MKKNIFSIMAIAAVAFTSCKDETPTSSELGEATINGSIWAELDLTNTTPEAIEGMQVTVIVDTENWDQDPDPSYNYEERVYTTTVDANGMYTLTIPATETGYDIDIMFGDVITTRVLADGETENVRVSEGDRTEFIYAGATLNLDDEANISVLASSDSETYGSATIYGTVRGDLDIGFTPEGSQPVPGGFNIIWRYQAGEAPYFSSDEDIYTVTGNADGTYSFTFATEALGDDAVYLDWGVADFEGSQIQLNAAGDGDTTVNGVWSATWLSGGSSDGIEYFDYEGGFNDGDIETNWDIDLEFNEF